MAADEESAPMLVDDGVAQDGLPQLWLSKLKDCKTRYPAGPTSFLQGELSTDAEFCDFVEWLWKEFPERADVLYQHSTSFQGVAEDLLAQTPPSAFHICAFAFDDRCSMKPAPGWEQSLTLAELFLKEGFITSGDPILAQHKVADPQSMAFKAPWEKPVGAECLMPFSVPFIKGRARVTSLMALLYVLFDGGVNDIQGKHKVLWESVCVLWTQHLVHHTKEEEVLSNLKLSLRGSLRKPCNVIQIAQMVRKLLRDGSHDYAGFVRKWNSQTIQSQQIKGRKATSLKLLFESAPQDGIFCLQMLNFQVLPRLVRFPSAY